MSTTQVTIAVIGHGEAGSRLAAGLLAAGAHVVGFDIKQQKEPTVPLSDTLEEAVAEADVVLAVTSATGALRLAQQVAPALKPGALYADLNTGTPSLKEKLAAEFPAHAFVDVAIMKPVRVSGINVPLAVAGPAGQAFVDLMAPLGLNLELVSDRVGQAAARELTLSILSKCVAGVVVDFMWAAESMGLTEWAYDHMLTEFDSFSRETAQRYLVETVANVKRREIEMLDVVEMLESAGYHSLFVPPTQLVYNKVYHSIPVPHSEPARDDE